MEDRWWHRWRVASEAERASLSCLRTRSSRPHSCPWALSAEAEQRILQARARTRCRRSGAISVTARGAVAPRHTDDPHSVLVAELEAFRRGISRPHGLAVAATMLQEGTDPDLVAHYRERIVDPRRARLRAILERGVRAGLLREDADLDLAVSTLTGSWYGYAVAGTPPPRDWALRLASDTWAALVRDRPASSG